MNYISLEFFVFLLITVMAYFLFPNRKYQWTVLLVASYVFYLYAGYKYAIFLVVTTISTYFTALAVESVTQRSKNVLEKNKSLWNKIEKKEYKNRIKKRQRRIIGLSITLNLGILVFLKYYGFFAGSLNQLLHLGNVSYSIPVLKLFLPLGISFYTFQSIGYVIDVYRGKITAERNMAKVALFISFFPQIIQGPIGFYDRLAFQLYEPHRFSFTRCKYGCELIFWGAFKKLVIADRAYIAINAVTSGYRDYSGATLTFVLFLYALQLYTDFSGGIDISRGIAQILGIDMEQNFRRPYFATTINDYWRRWHITLGTWMKEYIFYPFALSQRITNLSKRIKKSKFGSTVIGGHITKVIPAGSASMLVFLLVGLWHGPNWKYVAFGLWNGGVILLSMLLEPIFIKLIFKLRINVNDIRYKVFQIIRTFFIVLIGYVFDVAPSLADAVYTFQAIIVNPEFRRGWQEIGSLGLKMQDYLILIIGAMLIFLVSLIQERNPQVSFRDILDRKPFIIRYFLILSLISLIVVFGIYGPGYNPADFVYMQF